MAGNRVPRTLFRGRMRTSTAIIGLLFVGVLLLWYGVRPDPEFTEEVVRVRTTRVTDKEAAQTATPDRGGTATGRRVAVPYAHAHAAGEQDSGGDPAAECLAGRSGDGSSAAHPDPPADVTPTPTPARHSGVFGLRRGEDPPPSPTPDSTG